MPETHFRPNEGQEQGAQEWSWGWAPDLPGRWARASSSHTGHWARASSSHTGPSPPASPNPRARMLREGQQAAPLRVLESLPRCVS